MASCSSRLFRPVPCRTDLQMTAGRRRRRRHARGYMIAAFGAARQLPRKAPPHRNESDTHLTPSRDGTSFSPVARRAAGREGRGPCADACFRAVSTLCRSFLNAVSALSYGRSVIHPTDSSGNVSATVGNLGRLPSVHASTTPMRRPGAPTAQNRGNHDL